MMYKPVSHDIQSSEQSSDTLKAETSRSDERRTPHVTASGMVSRPSSIESQHAVTDQAGTSNTVESTQKEGGFGLGPAARRNHLWLEASSSSSSGLESNEASSSGSESHVEGERGLNSRQDRMRVLFEHPEVEQGSTGIRDTQAHLTRSKTVGARMVELNKPGNLLPRPEAMSDLGGASEAERSSASAKQRKSYQRQISAPKAGSRGTEDRGFGQERGTPLPRPISLAELGKLLRKQTSATDLVGASEAEKSSAGAKQQKSYQRQISAPEAGSRGTEDRDFGQEWGKPLPRPEAWRKQTSATDLVGASEPGRSEAKDKGLYDQNLKVFIDFTVKQVRKQVEENEVLKWENKILEDRIISKELNYLKVVENLESEKEKTKGKDKEIRELKQEMINKDEELRKVYEKIINLQQEMQNKVEELISKGRVIGNLERELHNRGTQLIEKNERIKQLIKEISNKDGEIREKDANIRALEDQMSDKDGELNMKDANIKALEDQMSDKDKEMKRKDANIRALEDQMSDKDKEMKRKDRKIERLYDESKTLIDNNKKLIDKGVETEIELEKRGELIKIIKDEIKDKNKKIKDKDAEITSLKEDRDRLTQKVEDRDRVIKLYKEGYRTKNRNKY